MPWMLPDLVPILLYTKQTHLKHMSYDMQDNVLPHSETSIGQMCSMILYVDYITSAKRQAYNDMTHM